MAPLTAALHGLFLQAAGTTSSSASNITVLVIVILALLLLTAITAGAETAYFSLKAKDVNYLKTKDSPSARQAIELIDQPKMLLATILVANNFVNIAIIISINLLAKQIFESIYGIPVEQVIKLHGAMYFSVQVIGVTFILVLFGEVLPKVYATQNNMRMALFSAPVLQVLNQLFRPVSRMLVSSSTYIEEKLSSKPAGNISTEDFEHAIELTVGHTATREEVNIFKGILKFGNITARQVMHTRLDVAGIQYDMGFPEVQEYAINMGYSRLPVYRENLDSIAGVVHTKDFLPYTEQPDFDWHQLIRPAHFIHEGKLIEDLLQEFQKKRTHFAVVVDEYGGTSGIVTLEDIMEEIIGDIRDEFDEEDLHYKKIDDHNYLFEGKTLINDMCRAIGEPSDAFDKVRGESDSVAGLILEISGRFPAVNETISYAQYDFVVLELDRMRIKRIKLSIRTDHADDEA